MQNTKFYILLGLLGAFIMVAVLRTIGTTKMDKYGLSYKEIDQKSVVLNPQYFHIIGIEDSKGTQYAFKAIDEHPRTGEMTYIRQDISDFSSENMNTKLLEWNLIASAYFTGEAFKENTNKLFPLDTIYQFDLAERKTIFNEKDFVTARAYVPPNTAADDWFSKIEDSAIIMIPLAIIPFLLLMFHDLLIFFFSNKRRDGITKIIQLGMITLAVGFFFSLLNPSNYAASRITQLILSMIMMYPLYFIFQSELPLIEQWNTKHTWKEDYKFLLIFIGGSILIYFANAICRLIDSSIFNSDGYTALEVGGRMHLEMGMAFSFALGNMLNNVRKYILGWWRRSKKVAVSESKALSSEAELNAMQASVNPHFLYNSLNSIASLAKTDPEKTEQMAIALSKFYKYNTNRDRSAVSSLGAEIELVRTYLKIEKIRFGERLNFEFDIDPQLWDMPLPHFMLQPLVENAIKYGYHKPTDKIWLKIQAKDNQASVEIKVFDQGEPFDDQLNSGYGLKSVMKKLELMYPEAHDISFVNQPEKHVNISINLNA